MTSIIQTLSFAAFIGILFYFLIYRNERQRTKFNDSISNYITSLKMSKSEKEIYSKAFNEEYESSAKEELVKKAKRDAQAKAKKKFGERK